jgi:hypothetical protein
MIKEFDNGAKIELNIVRLIMTQNGWEYFVTDDAFTEDIVRCVVAGDEVEIGDVSLEEIAPYIIFRSKSLDGALPAPGWKWYVPEVKEA